MGTRFIEGVPNGFTSAQLSVRYGVPIWVLNHALRSRGIHPAGRCGIIRVFHESQLPMIEAALQETRNNTRGESRVMRVAGECR